MVGLISPQVPKQEPPQPAGQHVIPTARLTLESPLGNAHPLGLEASDNDEITAILAQVQERVAMLAMKKGKYINGGLGSMM